MAVVHVEGNEEPHCAHDGDPCGVEVGKGVEEERHDDAAQHHAALDQELPVCDRVHALQLGNIHHQLSNHLRRAARTRMYAHAFLCVSAWVSMRVWHAFLRVSHLATRERCNTASRTGGRRAQGFASPLVPSPLAYTKAY